MAAADALTPEAFAARLTALNPPKGLALALSGGRDSVALLRLCADYAARNNSGRLFAFTVDHGLRPEAAAEARMAADWAKQAGVPHRILNWTGGKPSSGVQSAARQARYSLLIEAAQEAGCEALLTAHTRDDQAETLFMRLSRGAGPKGLGAIRADGLAASGAGAPVRLVRPLLSFSRAAVTRYLASAGQAYVDDPSNDDPAYERVRVRALLAALAEQDLLTAGALSEAAAKAARAAERLAAQEDDLFQSLSGCFYGWGGVSVDRWRADAPGAAGLARRLIHAAGAAEFSPDEDAAAQALANALATGAGTLGGALIKRWKERLWFLREPAALLGRAGTPAVEPQPLQTSLLWDRRFIISAPAISTLEGAPPQGAPQIAPMGAAAGAYLGAGAGLFTGPGEALAALPGLYQQGVLIGAPALPFMSNKMSAGLVTAKSLVRERYLGRIVRF